MLRIKIANSKIDYPELTLVLLLSYSHIAAGIGWITTGVIGQTFGFVTSILKVIVAFLMLYTIARYIKRVSIDSIVIIVVFVVLYLFSMINDDTYYEVMRQGLLNSTFLDCIPVYVLFRLCANYESFWRYIKYVSWVILTVFTIAFFTYDVGHVYRSFSAGLIIAVGFFTIEWLYKEKRLMLVPSIFSMVLLTIGGRRSSLISVLLGVIIILIFKKDYRKIFFGVLIFAAVYFLYEPLINLLYNISLDMGIRSRVLLKMVSGNAMEDSHRFEQWRYVLQMVFASPLKMMFGLGIAGERYYMLNHFSHMELQGYPHGIIVEIIGHYGIILGVVFEVYLFVIAPVKIFKSNSGMSNKTIFIYSIVLASALLFQDSYIQNRYFFLYIAILVSFLGLRKEKFDGENRYTNFS